MVCELPAGRAVVDKPPVMRFIPPCERASRPTPRSRLLGCCLAAGAAAAPHESRDLASLPLRPPATILCTRPAGTTRSFIPDTRGALLLVIHRTPTRRGETRTFSTALRRTPPPLLRALLSVFPKFLFHIQNLRFKVRGTRARKPQFATRRC
jgi:hypothetical protein